MQNLLLILSLSEKSHTILNPSMLFSYTAENRLLTRNLKRGWFSGRIVPCHGTDPGSIPGSRIHFAGLLMVGGMQQSAE